MFQNYHHTERYYRVDNVHVFILEEGIMEIHDRKITTYEFIALPRFQYTVHLEKKKMIHAELLYSRCNQKLVNRTRLFIEFNLHRTYPYVRSKAENRGLDEIY